MKKTVFIEGMSCSHCANAVRESLEALDGIDKVKVDLKGKKAVVKGENLDDGEIKKAVSDAGYEVVNITE
ncbi:heavy-metal-associated domain-containing protein [Sporanaerobacter sp. PP17-6a]|jgi:copper chaperone CopZ|uniref:heavy-metal-associated domain-containing protein n=1 Tax=Sporanaerobacter sp. PP17-6a TaxID=1891289 RepID=UPI0008A04D03|nr:cation transporter [Sporanaerobacter sp. PP17-6a]SCL92782.1 Copper-ion-binding protein [Sporanaerobacter sp. PP17-6a]